MEQLCLALHASNLNNDIPFILTAAVRRGLTPYNFFDAEPQ